MSKSIAIIAGAGRFPFLVARGARQAGCRVDVIGYFSVRAPGGTRTIARTILENIEVGAVGPRLSPVSPTAEEQSGKKDTRRQKKVRAVTLFVRPDKAPLLHMAEPRGKIKLAMRNYGDVGGSDKGARVTAEELYGEEPAQFAHAGSDGLLSRLGKMFGQFKPPAAPVIEPLPAEPKASQPAQPALAWVMRIWNGDEMRTLGWHGLDSIDAIDLTAAVQSKAKKEGPPPAPSPPAQTDGATQVSEEPAPAQPGDGTEEP